MSDHVHVHGSVPPPGSRSTPTRLIGVLSSAGALAGLLLVVTFLWAQPRIDRHNAELLNAAIAGVLGTPKHIQTVFLYQGYFASELPAGVDSAGLDRVYAGYDEANRLVGYAIVGAQPGFTDEIKLIFGYDPARRVVLGMKVLQQRETPGLGDKIVSDTTFVGGFRAVVAPLKGVKRGFAKRNPGEVDMITGATVSSRAVIAIVNRRIEELSKALEAPAAGRTP